MLFNSTTFIAEFLPISLIGYYLAGRISTVAAAAWLCMVSIAFYAYWRWPSSFVLLMCGSIAFNYTCSILLTYAQNSPKWQNLILAFGILCNISLLFYFKYLFHLFGFLHDIDPNLPDFGQVVLPLGISFFTFTQIGYLIDCKQGLAKERGFVNYVLFVTFFPHLIAGPILHHREMMPQFADRKTYRFDPENLAVGATLLIIGLAKKVLIADTISGIPDRGFAHPEALLLWGSWATILAYALQLYFDFSGYSDMAIGIARMFGIRFPPNFNSPYKATSIIDFWQRWHMTLTRYLTLYLYTPMAMGMTRRRAAKGLSVSRRATAEFPAFFSLIFLPTLGTMFLAGIWHGAGLNYIIFGLLHAFYLSANHAWRIFGPAAPKLPRPMPIAWGIRAAQTLLTLLCVFVAQDFFRAETTGSALQLLAGLAGLHGIDRSSATIGLHDSATIALLFLAVWVLPNAQELTNAFAPILGKVEAPFRRWMAWQPNMAWGIGFGLIFAISLATISRPTRFLYFQF
jgi:alginate O-acetyltransferase complex protein AlgI